PGVRSSWGSDFEVYNRSNIRATQCMLEAARKSPQLKTLLYVSSSSVYVNAARFPTHETDLPSPVSPYGVTKLAAEHLCSLYAVNYGVPTVSLRFFTVYCARPRPDMAFHRFLRAALTGAPILLYGDGEQTRDFTYIAHIVAANRAAGDRGTPGAVYNIGGGSRVTVNH